MIGGEHHRAREIAQVLQPAHLELQEDARERQNPGRETDPADEPRDRRSIPAGKRDLRFFRGT